MDDPLSPPLACLYVAYDEHHFKIRQIPLTSNNDDVLLRILRFMDDVLLLLAIPLLHFHNDTTIVSDFLTSHLYEHDIEDKVLQLLPDNDSMKFLDADIIVYNNRKNIKITYHNKNDDFTVTQTQTVDIFLPIFACTSTKVNISAFTAVLTRIHDFTTVPHDMIPLVLQIISEMIYLQYSQNMIHAILLKVNRIRPHLLWTAIDQH